MGFALGFLIAASRGKQALLQDRESFSHNRLNWRPCPGMSWTFLGPTDGALSSISVSPENAEGVAGNAASS
jgi:hypothetical protein